ncbi:hypothetical protein [Staphylococcus aureus]|uniref:hypothetical protein n=1 Tax=Staphylococcus aureus TaxID=1280 RepID=UPI00118923C6|nr:hypothetical protein [Staphylococcus aureus]QDS48311.1 hypothetical protein FP477_14295 [Staphylococcus aureus]
MRIWKKNDFIASIEVQNEAYSRIIITIARNIDEIKPETLKSRVKSIGESIRENTAGIINEGDYNRLPIVVFKDAENRVIAEYTTRERNASIIFH